MPLSKPGRHYKGYHYRRKTQPTPPSEKRPTPPFANRKSPFANRKPPFANKKPTPPSAKQVTKKLKNTFERGMKVINSLKPSEDNFFKNSPVSDEELKLWAEHFEHLSLLNAGKTKKQKNKKNNKQ